MVLTQTVLSIVIVFAMTSVPVRGGAVGAQASTGATGSMSDCRASADIPANSAMDSDCAAMAAADDAAMSGKCGGSNGHGHAGPADCLAFCNCVTALPTVAAVIPEPGPGHSVALTIVSFTIGHDDCPDPYPPKPFILI
jgi:hypothetical protein